MQKHLGLLVPSLLLGVAALAPAADDAYRPLGLAKTWAIGGPGRWDYTILDADGSHLYVTRSIHMQGIDTATGKVVMDVPNCAGAHGVALAPALKRLFISNGEGSVQVVDSSTGKVLGMITAPDDADCIIADPASQQILAFCGDAGVMFPLAMDVDPAGKGKPTLDLHGKPEFAVADGAGHVYNAINDRDEVVFIDTTTNTIMSRHPLAPGKSPTGMSMDAEHHRIFIGCRNQKLIVMNSDTGAILADFPIGHGVDATAFNQGLAYASCGDGTLTVLKEDNPDTYHVAEVAKTAPGARTMAVAADGTVYLPCAEMGPTPEPTADNPHPRPVPVPNSFKILVMVPGFVGSATSATPATSAAPAK